MYNPLDLSGKLILVTGASSGIGRGVAVVLSRLGARLVLSGRHMDTLAVTRSALDNSAQHLLMPFDLADTWAIPQWVKEVASQAGRPLSGLVHSAGVSATVPIRAMSERSVNAVLGPNLHAALALLKGCSAKGVIREAGASLVMISSIAGLVGEASMVAYSASKGALHSASRSAALELAPKNIRVNCVAPGLVETPMLEKMREALPEENYRHIVEKHPLGLGTVEDIAYAVAYLLSDASRWVTGTTLVVDGGYTA